MKHKNEEINWKAIVRNAFVDEYGKFHFVWGMLVALAGIFMAVVITFFVISWSIGTPMERYTKQYEACIATERFTDEQCHDIGIQAMDVE